MLTALRELLTEHMETIDSMEALMLAQGLGCWNKLRMAQLEGEYLMEKANATIQSGNAYLRDMEDLDLQTGLASNSWQQPAVETVAKMAQVQPQPGMTDICLAMLDPAQEALDNLQVTNEVQMIEDTAA